jgi:hypothetical protein
VKRSEIVEKEAVGTDDRNDNATQLTVVEYLPKRWAKSSLNLQKRRKPDRQK